MHMKPGNPMFISESLARAQRLPLTLFMEFADTSEHPPCRYPDSATTALDVPDEPRICSRHRAALSLDRLLPHRSRVHGINFLLNSSNPDWEDGGHSDNDPILLYHQFFSEGLQNLQRLDFRAIHLDEEGLTIVTPASFFAMHLPHLKELKYLGASGGLMLAAVDLTSCEIGEWYHESAGRAGPPLIRRGDFQTFLNNNRTLESLTINDCDFLDDSPQVTTLMTDLKFLKIDCSTNRDLEMALDSILTPQLNCLNTVTMSLGLLGDIQVTATDEFDHTFIFPLCALEELNAHPLRRSGAEIVTLRLGEGVCTGHPHRDQTLYEFFETLDTLRVLECEGMITDCTQALSISRIVPRLEVVRVAVDQTNCMVALQTLASGLKLRMESGNPLAAVEPLVPRGVEGLDQGLRAEWERCFKEVDISQFLSN